MGTPNFYSYTDGLNVGLDLGFFATMGFDTTHDSDDSERINSLMYNKAKKVEQFIAELPTLFFHDISLNYGEDSGFQIYMEANYEKDREKYIERSLHEWTEKESFTDTQGWEVELRECPYFRKNIKNLTAFSLSRAMDKEHKVLHNMIVNIAKELGMGEVVGKGFCSSVKYPLEIKTFKI